MKATEMKPNIPYRAISRSKDRTIEKGQLMWLSKNKMLNLIDKFGGGFLLEEEWTSPETSSFEVEEDTNYKVLIIGKDEILMKKIN